MTIKSLIDWEKTYLKHVPETTVPTPGTEYVSSIWNSAGALSWKNLKNKITKNLMLYRHWPEILVKLWTFLTRLQVLVLSNNVKYSYSATSNFIYSTIKVYAVFENKINLHCCISSIFVCYTERLFALWLNVCHIWLFFINLIFVYCLVP